MTGVSEFIRGPEASFKDIFAKPVSGQWRTAWPKNPSRRKST